MFKRSQRGRAFAALAAAGALSVTLAACGSDDSSDDSAAEETAAETAEETAADDAGDDAGDDAAAEDTGAPVAVSLILKNQTNPFFVAKMRAELVAELLRRC